MLIDKGIKEGDVVSLKLTSGEELIARLVEDGPLFLKIGKPLVVGMSPQGPALMPYLFTVSPDRDVKLAKGTVVVMEPTEKQFADQYLTSTTGIAMR